VIHDFQVDIDDVSAIEVVPSILQVMQATTGMGFVAVARVTEERWVACAVLDMIDFGLGPGGELTVKSTICDEIRQDHQLVAVDHFSENPIWIGHHTPLQYGLQSYISVPIILGDGSFFGTLCAVDPNPAQVDNPRVIGMAKLFADLIARHLDARRHLVETEQRLTTELETSHLRDQFIAILGHDIKNPVASIDAGARLLRKSVTDPQGRTILSLMEQSVKRVSNIVDNVMDFARGLGGGMALRPEFTPVGEMLEAIVAEFRSSIRSAGSRPVLPCRTTSTSIVAVSASCLPIFCRTQSCMATAMAGYAAAPARRAACSSSGSPMAACRSRAR
jgi:signal transduction histidine kinase